MTAIARRSWAHDRDVLVVGAGPHALTICRYLAAIGIRPSVIAPDRWCDGWTARMQRLDVTMLRSHHTQHPDPDRYALAAFGGDPIEAWAGPWSTPTTAVFGDFCAHLVARGGLDDVLRRDLVERIEPLQSGLRVRTQAGLEYRARRIVLATNAMRPLRPGWASAAAARAPLRRILHSDELDLRDVRLDGERVLVVGGGLTAAGIAVGAVKRGAEVTLVARRPLVLRVADAESNWHGPARLCRFFAERDPQRRLQMSRAARGGGTVTPAMGWAVRAAADRGALELLESCEVQAARWHEGRFSVRIAGDERHFDRIWLATGHELDVDGEPLLRDVAQQRPAQIVGGLPVLDSACRWPGTQLHLMGGLAELELGPLARNLAGARMAADRIVGAISPRSAREYPHPPEAASAHAVAVGHLEQ